MLSVYHTKRNTFHSISRLLLAKCNDNAEHIFSIIRMCMYMCVHASGARIDDAFDFSIISRNICYKIFTLLFDILSYLYYKTQQ